MEIQENISLKNLNTFGVDHQARFFATAKVPDDLRELLKFSDHQQLPILVLGGGSNLLFSQDYAGIVVQIDWRGYHFEETANGERLLQVGAGENWHETVTKCIEHGWQGLENLALIPGNVGAAPMQNIGAYGLELADRFHSLQAFDCETGTIETFSKQQCQFSYRDSYFKSGAPGRFIILRVTLSLPDEPDWRLGYAGILDALADHPPSSKRIADIVTKIRQQKLPDPRRIGNAGSFFKNPIIAADRGQELQAKHPAIPLHPYTADLVKIPAAWLIEQCGLKGVRQGDAGVSEQHSLVLVNHGNASAAQILKIADLVQQKVNVKFGIELEPEPKIV